MGSAVDVERYVAPTAADLSVVVCAYTLDHWGDTHRAIRALQAQHDPVGEIVLVIDHNDQLLAAARAAFPGLVVIPNADQPGLSRARDAGAAHASGSIVAFLDDNAVAAPDWSRRTAAGYDGPDVIGVGGRIDPAWPRGSRPSWWPPEFDWVVGCSYTGLPRGRYPVRNMIGASMSLRANVLGEVGTFDPWLDRVIHAVTGYEETEFCIRARHRFAGTEIIYEPCAVVRHTVAPERATWRYFLRRCHGVGRFKAHVAQLSSGEDALAAERDYVRQTLPIGALSGLFSRDPRRGFAVILGVLATSLGYYRARSESSDPSRASEQAPVVTIPQQTRR